MSTSEKSHKEVVFKYCRLLSSTAKHVAGVNSSKADEPIVIVAITNSECNTTRSMNQADSSMAYMIH